MLRRVQIQARKYLFYPLLKKKKHYSLRETAKSAIFGAKCNTSKFYVRCIQDFFLRLLWDNRERCQVEEGEIMRKKFSNETWNVKET